MTMYRKLSVAALAALVCLAAAAASAKGLPKPASAKPEAQKLIDQAWEASHQDVSGATYKKCVELMKQADKLDPKNPGILTDLARYTWEYGNNLPKATDEQKEALEKIYASGIAAAEQSLAVKETVGGHYWYAVNKAASLEFESIFSQAAGFPTILKHAGYVSDNEPDYFYGAPGRLWSEVLVRVPKVVVKMVGYDVQQVVDDISESIKLEPRYLNNYVYKARFIFTYFETKDEPLQLLETALKADPAALPEEINSNKDAQADGRVLWKQITGKDYPNR